VDVWLVSGIDAPRGATVDEVAAQVAQALQIAEPGAGDASEVAVHTIRKFRNPSEAYAYACEQAARNDRICVFGSFHTVAEVLKNMVERR
jgi:dihydrofolate synthase/folylpolyglutamate synthase